MKYRIRPREVEAVTLDDLREVHATAAKKLRNGELLSFGYAGHQVEVRPEGAYAIPTPKGKAVMTRAQVLIVENGTLYLLPEGFFHTLYEPAA